MPDLAAIKVVIGRRLDGSADYPDFNSLPVVQASGMDWSRYIDVEGCGWCYDRVSGHDDEDMAAGSPRGVQHGVLLIPEQFAIEAVAQFAATCTRLNEATCETFYDDRHVFDVEDEQSDESVLEQLERELRLLKELEGTPEAPPNIAGLLIKCRRRIKRAIDPTHIARGVRDNPRSTWQRMKANRSITFRE